MRIAATLLGLSLAFLAGPALAHHPGPNPTPQLPRSRVALDLEAAEFAVLGGGYWRLAALSLEHVLLERLSIGARIPLAHVDFADGHDAFGPGDIDVGLRVMPYQSYHQEFALLVGLGFELPTGSVDEALGGGHFMATPMIGASYRPHESFMLSLLASDHIPIGELDDAGSANEPAAATAAAPASRSQHAGDGDNTPPPAPGPNEPDPAGVDEDAAHGSVLAPHSNHEMRIKLIASYLWAPLYASLAGEAVIMFEHPDPLGPLTIEPEVGVRPTDDTRIGVSIALPIAGQKRLDWHGRLGVEYLF